MPSAFKLTARQERFVLLIVKGEAQTTAYEQAGYSVKSKAVAATNASNLMKSPNVQGRLAELRNALAVRTVVSLDSLTRDLDDIRSKAMANLSFGPAVAAVVAMAKLHGFMVDRAELMIEHRPAPLPTKILELSEKEWIEQFGVEAQRHLKLAARTVNKK
jgi:hypothetical protein